ncbi:phosphoribosylformylglycinamidine synthase [Burkholderia pseudomallei]|nr:phosphoribosylformylglycinamidine synthase [Burkholderia pseudomallei]OMR01133.1 phosphoribosylformylglycinamidine synthase [Burkholderia pseudomallei]OMU25234.1 phosphoribosylformylglycinamidine synthase [Burkholderia pseudomallei]OMU33386.1 phosphoribosylformylglycinamidine synthase [Burkholderia pseudomallei]OMU44076.1 phosphoribosylformylglycinamidine synthase [Burkholderia pseudomallei]
MPPPMTITSMFDSMSGAASGPIEDLAWQAVHGPVKRA